MSISLGGLPRQDHHGAWSVITEASALAVEIADESTADVLYFQLANTPQVGVLELRFGAWSLAEVLGAATVRAVLLAHRPLCELLVTTRDVTTLGGRIVRYPVPRLALRT
ncbi:hypothetical protein [Kitasatospora sp. NPDC057936]|uniref:hypothetical protein n=1 Tax=Kitasatospora sp. NPDC057936 TaxID=3346283 RepID=UPI0036DD895A